MSVTTLIVGCGYLGVRVAGLLRSRGDRVFGTTRSPARADVLRGLGIEPIMVDVLDPGTLGALPAADRAFYCVGYDRSAGVPMRDVYIDGFRDALDCLDGRVGRLVLASSTGVYGSTEGDRVDEDSPTIPLHESGRVVLESEELLTVFADRRGLDASILRFAGLYGPGRLPRRARLERGEPIVGDPARPLNLVHVDDASAASVAALDRGRPGRVYLVCDDRPLPRGEYYRLAARLLGAPEPRFVAPAPGSPEADREASSKRVSNRRLRDELGVSFAYPDIHAGLPASFGRG